MIPFLLAILVFAVDPTGFEPAALKRAAFLAVGPVLFLAAWRDGALKRLSAAPLTGALGCLVLLHGWAFVTATISARNGLPVSLPLAATGSLLLLALVALRAREDANDRPFRLGDVLLAIGVIVAGYAIAQRAGIDPIFDNPGGAAVAFFGNTNRAAEFLAPLVPLAIAFRGSRTGFARLVAGIALPLTTTALLLTNSRAGAIAALAGAILALAASRRAGTRIAIDLVLLGIGCLAPLAIAGSGAYSLKSVEESEASIASLDYEPNRQRTLLLSATLEMVRERPIVGFGAGSFRFTFPEFRDPEEARMRTLGGALSSAEDPHDEFLRLASESGVPAAVLFALFLLLSLLAARDATLWPSGHPLRSAAPGYAAALLSLGVVSLFRSTLDHAPVAVMTCALAGSLAACRERGRESALAGPAFFVLPIHLAIIAIIGFRLLIGESLFIAGERALRRGGDGAAIRALDALELGRSFAPTNLALLQREAVLEEARARVEPDRARNAIAARRRILALDPRHVTSNLRLAARELEAEDVRAAMRHLNVALSALGEKGIDAGIARLLEQKEERAAARLELERARDGAGSLADLRLGAEHARREGRVAYAIHLLEAYLIERPADGDAAAELGDALAAAGAKELADAAHLRAQVCRAATALERGDANAAMRAIENARRHGRLFEVEVLAAVHAANSGDRAPIDALAATKRTGRPASWFLAAIEPLKRRPDLAPHFARLGL